MWQLLEIPGAIIAVGAAIRVVDWRPKPKVKKPDFVVCGCGHGMHDHDPETNRCAGRVELYKWSKSVEREVLDGYGECTCRQFL